MSNISEFNYHQVNVFTIKKDNSREIFAIGFEFPDHQNIIYLYEDHSLRHFPNDEYLHKYLGNESKYYRYDKLLGIEESCTLNDQSHLSHLIGRIFNIN